MQQKVLDRLFFNIWTLKRVAGWPRFKSNGTNLNGNGRQAKHFRINFQSLTEQEGDIVPGQLFYETGFFADQLVGK